MSSVKNASKSGQVVRVSGSVQEGEEGNGDRELMEQGSSGPPSGPRERDSEKGPPSRRSRMARRGDGRWMVSIVDARDRDLTGYEQETFVTLHGEDEAFAEDLSSEAQDEMAARIIGRMPKKR